MRRQRQHYSIFQRRELNGDVVDEYQALRVISLDVYARDANAGGVRAVYSAAIITCRSHVVILLGQIGMQSADASATGERCESAASCAIMSTCDKG